MPSPGPSPRATVRRLPARASYEPEQIRAILAEGFLCHLGFQRDGQPFVIPTLYAPAGDRLYLHGSPASRMLRALREGIEVCVSVTLVDGLVIARSHFHHSVNYRSVVVFGRAREVTDAEEKRAALAALVDHVVPGRGRDARPPSERELRATTVLALPLDEASAKLRTGGPLDDEPDYALPVWAGVLPLRLRPDPPQADARLLPGVEPPAYLRAYARPRAG
jgi:hypothetical protein